MSDKTKGILNKLREMSEERKANEEKEINEEVETSDEEVNEEEEINEAESQVDWNKIERLVNDYQKRSRGLYDDMMDEALAELPEEYREALNDARDNLLKSDFRRVKYLIGWADIIDPSQLRSYAEKHL